MYKQNKRSYLKVIYLKGYKLLEFWIGYWLEKCDRIGSHKSCSNPSYNVFWFELRFFGVGFDLEYNTSRKENFGLRLYKIIKSCK